MTVYRYTAYWIPEKTCCPPPRDWPTVHRTYERLETSRYTYWRLFKFAITYKWLHFYLCITRSTSFLVTKIRAVVHTRWRDCQPGDITCQHKTTEKTTKHYERSLYPANAACIRILHRSPKKLDRRPILLLRVHIYIRTCISS